MERELAARRADLVVLTKHDPDPKVRHRAHVLIDLLESPSLAQAAARTGVSESSVRRWRTRFLARGAQGLRDHPRSGRPPKLADASRAVLRQALEDEPMTYGYPAATWTMADLTDLLHRQGWAVSAATVNRTVHALGYVHRRPRHDLRHRQDAEAVASAQHVLATLQKRGRISAAECDSSISTNASCTPIPTWQRCGAAAGKPTGFPPPERTGA